MTPTSTARRFGMILLQIIIVLIMMGVGLIILLFSLIGAPENFDDWATSRLSDLGGLRFFLGFLLLGLIPWYRKVPLVLIIAGSVYVVVTQGDPYTLAIGLTVWMVRAQHRWQWIISYIGLGLIGLSILRHVFAVIRWGDQFDTAFVVTLVLVFGISALLLVILISQLVRQRRRTQHAHDVVAEVAQDRDVISHEMTRQSEREFLAREVHDTLAQRLTALSLQAGQMQKSLNHTDTAQLSSALQETKHYSDQALRDLRNLVSSLRDHGEQQPATPSVAPSGFQDLTALIEDAAHQGVIMRPSIMLNDYDAAPDDLQRAVLRITQEALTNVLRHSTDQTVDMVIEGQPGDGLLLQYTNHRPVRSAFVAGSGSGLLGITERAQLLGGTADIEELADSFRLTIRLPWTAVPPEER